MAHKKIGIALSAGGARGFAHLGVLKALINNGIEVDMIAGTSAGALVGAAIAAGMKVEDVIAVGKGVSWFNMAAFSYSPRGLLTNEPMGNFIRSNFPVSRFEDLNIPFSAVACDLITGNEVIFRETGDLIEAVRASCAIPGVFVPIEDGGGRLLVDGGVASPMPTGAVRELGAEFVIAVDLLSCGIKAANTPSTLVGTFIQSAMMMIRNAAKSQHYRADIVIEPAISHIRPDEIKRMDELVKLGEEAGKEALGKILELISR